MEHSNDVWKMIKQSLVLTQLTLKNNGIDCTIEQRAQRKPFMSPNINRILDSALR
jgi:hypothetical protein